MHVEPLLIYAVWTAPDSLTASQRDRMIQLLDVLQEARGDDSCPAGQRIGQLIVEVRLVLSGLMSYNPKRWSTLR